MEDLGHSGETISLSWLGNASGSPPDKAHSSGYLKLKQSNSIQVYFIAYYQNNCFNVLQVFLKTLLN